MVAAAEVSEWGKEVDSRLAAALARRDAAAAGSVFAEYALRDGAAGGSAAWSAP